MHHPLPSWRGVSALAVLALLSLPPDGRSQYDTGPVPPRFSKAGFWGYGWWNYPAGHFGYDLDDTNPTFYGNGRYREYYHFGRTFGASGHPGPYFLSKIYKDEPGHGVILPPMTAEQYAARQHTASPVAHLLVQVPADAELWLDDTKGRQTGATRVFITPPLIRDEQYTYRVRARWTEGGKAVEQIRTVVVRAGDRASVVFPEARRGEQAAR